MKTLVLAVSVLAVVVLAGCTPPTKNIDLANDQGKAVMELDYRDFDQAATSMVSSMLASGTFKKPDGSRYVVTTAKVVNDTMQRIDTEQLTFKIEQELMNSGQVTMSSAVGGNGAPDEMVYQMRDVRDSAKSDEFKQSTMPGKGQIIAPELSVSGKILQRVIRYDSNMQQVEYYFQLRVTDIASGLTAWQKETLIGKRGSNKVVPW
jgi:penicillin-binding protein activator